MSKVRILFILLSLFLPTGTALSPDQDESQHILKNVSQTYKTLTSYCFEANSIVEIKTERTQMKMERPILLAAIKPDKIRMEVKSQLMDLLVVSNGPVTWEYMPQLNQYIKRTGGPTTIVSKGVDGIESTSDKEEYLHLMAVALGVLLPRYDDILEGLKRSNLLREESLEINGASMSCYVIEAEYDKPEAFPGAKESPKTFWIDRERFVVLRERYIVKIPSGEFGAGEQTHTLEFKAVKVNEALPETLFSFTPPEGAKEGEELSSPSGKKKKQP
jgi:outer membrane lipoprotein-sorting protein